MSALPLLVGVGTLAVAAGTLAVPAARRVAFGSVRHDWLAGELDLDRVDPDGFTVRCKTGAVVRVFRLAGESYDTKPEGEQFALHERRAAFLPELIKKRMAGGCTGEQNWISDCGGPDWRTEAMKAEDEAMMQETANKVAEDKARREAKPVWQRPAKK